MIFLLLFEIIFSMELKDIETWKELNWAPKSLGLEKI